MMFRKRKRSVPPPIEEHKKGPGGGVDMRLRDRGMRDYMVMEGANGGGSNGYGGGDSASSYTPPAPASPPQPPIDQTCIFHQQVASPSDIQYVHEQAMQATKRILLHQALLASDSGVHSPRAAIERERIDKRVDDELEQSRRVQTQRANQVFASFLPPHLPLQQALLLPHLDMLWPAGHLLQARIRLNNSSSGTTPEGGELDDCWMTVSSGLTNSDMPTRFRLDRFRIRRGSKEPLAMLPGVSGGEDKIDEIYSNGSGVSVYACDRGSHSLAVSLRPRLELDTRWAGYGYEIGVITRSKQSTWVAHCLSFMVSKAIMDDYNLRGVIEQFGAATFERMPVLHDRTAHFLIAKAPPELFPKDVVSLPNGSMQLYLMTVITDEELQFGMHNRALDLYHRLRHAGKAYISDLDRPSIDLRRDSDRIADEAAVHGDVATLATLLSSGYRVFPGNPILCLAIKKGRDDRSAANVLRFFIEGNKEGDSSSVVDEELVKRLAQVRDEDNYTALHWAARNNFAECVQLLVEKGGVDIELRGTRTAVTALHLAANFGALETLKLLIAKGANLTSDALPDRQGEVTPLMLALDSEDEHSYDACKALIQAGVNVNSQDWAGSTVLHKMSRVVPRYLMRAIEFPGKEKGREVSYFIRDGEFGKRVENRVDERYIHDYPEAEEELFSKYFGGFCPMHKAYMAMLSKLGLLMRSGADVGLRNSAGMLALHNFAGEGGLREVRAVLDSPALSSSSSTSTSVDQEWKKIINSRDSSGRTPLWMACAHEKGAELAAKIVHWLISRGADATLGDDCGITPLHVAAVFGNLPLASLLVKHAGASPHALTTRGGGQLFYTHSDQVQHVFPAGVSPLHVAKKEGHFHLISFFTHAEA